MVKSDYSGVFNLLGSVDSLQVEVPASAACSMGLKEPPMSKKAGNLFQTVALKAWSGTISGTLAFFEAAGRARASLIDAGG